MSFDNFRVYLRAFEPEDYKTTINWRKDSKIWNDVVGRKYFVSSEYEKKWINDSIFNNQNNVVLAVCLKEDDSLIGIVILRNIDWFNRNASFSKMIGERKMWGKGLGKELTMLMLYHGLIELGLERIYARQLLDNVASIKVNERCGFKNEGVLRKEVFKNGEFHDLNVMGVIRQDFEELLANVTVEQLEHTAN